MQPHPWSKAPRSRSGWPILAATLLLAVGCATPDSDPHDPAADKVEGAVDDADPRFYLPSNVRQVHGLEGGEWSVYELTGVRARRHVLIMDAPRDIVVEFKDGSSWTCTIRPGGFVTIDDRGGCMIVDGDPDME